MRREGVYAATPPPDDTVRFRRAPHVVVRLRARDQFQVLLPHVDRPEPERADGPRSGFRRDVDLDARVLNPAVCRDARQEDLEDGQVF